MREPEAAQRIRPAELERISGALRVEGEQEVRSDIFYRGPTDIHTRMTVSVYFTPLPMFGFGRDTAKPF
jgi:hypothetical protein